MDKIQEVFDNFSTDGFMEFVTKLLTVIFDMLSKIYGWSGDDDTAADA